MKFSSVLLIALSSCTSISPWKLDAIGTGDPLFDCARLSHKSASSPLHLELFHAGGEISAFLSLLQFQFHPSPEDPTHVKAKITIGEETREEELPLLEGKMRLRLPLPLIHSLLTSLREGKKVAILVDGFEAIWEPDGFLRPYERWERKAPLPRPFLKSPFM